MALECSSAIASASLSMESRESSLAIISCIALTCSRYKPRTTAKRLLAMIDRPKMTAQCSQGVEDGKSGESTTRSAATANGTAAAKTTHKSTLEQNKAYR